MCFCRWVVQSHTKLFSDSHRGERAGAVAGGASEMPLRILANRDAEADGAAPEGKEEPPPPATPSKRATTSKLPPSFIFNATVETPAFTSPAVDVKLDATGQHTISWSAQLALKAAPSAVVPPGSCNVYLFPAVDGTPLKGAQLEVLRQLILAIANDRTCRFFDEPDAVGAFLIHAITVANTDDAVELSSDLVSSRPILLTQVHVNHRAGFPLFAGESCLHICAVNRREALFCRMIDLTTRQLGKDQAVALYQSQAQGVFFDEMPMRFYGGTPLACAYAARVPCTAAEHAHH